MRDTVPKEEMLAGILGNISLLVMLAGVLFSATSIVSEFEERTALILFTRPVRKWAIYMGKLLASIITIGAMMLIYYLVTVIACFITQGGIVSSVGLSIGMCFCAIFAMAGLSLLMSAIAKKGSTASIMTLVMVLLIFSIVAALLNQYGDVDTWWALSSLMNDISGCIGHTEIISYDPLITEFIVGSDTAGRSAAGLLAWGLGTNIAAFLLFRRRDF